jgi:hypothetical protein
MRPLPTACLVALLLAAPALAEEPPAEEVWYAERISAGDSPVQVEHFWSKGRRLRSEAVLLGHPIITIVRGDQYIMIDELTGQGVSIERSARAVAQDATRVRPFGDDFEVLREAGAEKVKTEEFGGRRCDLWRLTDDQGRREVCVTPDEPHLPLVRRMWVRGSGQSLEARYVEWSRDLDVPDSFFEPDPRIQMEYVTYQDYVDRASTERIGPAPPLHRDLLHGR